MKNLFFLVLLPFLFTGCMTVTANYNPEYNSLEKNDYISKVNKSSVSVDYSDFVLKRSPTSLSGSALTYEIHNELFSKVSFDFFSQYFNNVKYNQKSSDYYSKVELIDFGVSFYSLGDGSKVYIKIKYSFYDKNKELFSKVYETTQENNIILRPFAFTKKESSLELIQKATFLMFETQIKPDILNAL